MQRLSTQLGGLALLVVVVVSTPQVGLADTIVGVSSLGSLAAACVGIHRNGGEHRRVWWIFVAGMAGLVLGAATRLVEASMTGVEFPFPSYADLIVIPSYGLILYAVRSLSQLRNTEQDRTVTLDAWVLGTSLGFLTWALLLASYVRDENVSTADRLVNSGYGLLSVMFVVAVAQLAARPGLRNSAFSLLALSAAAFIAQDTLAILITAGHHLNYVFTISSTGAFILFATATHDPGFQRLTDEASVVSAQLTRPRQFILTFALLTSPFVLLVMTVRGRLEDIPLYIGGSAVVSMLVITRLVGLFRAKEKAADVEQILRSTASTLLGESNEESMVLLAIRFADQVGEGKFDVEGSIMAVDGKHRLVLASGASFDIGSFDFDHASGAQIADVPLTSPAVAHLPPNTLALTIDGGHERCVLFLSAKSPTLIEADRSTIEAIFDQLFLALRNARLTNELARERSEKRFRALVQGSSDIVMIVDGGGQLRFASPAFSRLLGRDLDHDSQINIFDLANARDGALLRRLLTSVQSFGAGGPVELRLRHEDDTPVWFEMLGIDHSNTAEIEGLVITAREIGDRKAADERLLSSESRFRSLVQNSTDIVAVITADDTFDYVSPAVSEILGYTPAQMHGTSLFDYLPESEVETIRALAESLTAPFAQIRFEIVAVASDDREVNLAVTLTDMRNQDSLHGIVMNARDITETRVLEKGIAHLSTTDELTGLTNRTEFVGLADRLIASSDYGRVAVLAVDIRNFRQVNDSLGHHSADMLLAEFADRIRTSLRVGDVAARLNGDSFAVILPHIIAIDEAHAICQRLVASASEPFLIDGQEVSISISVGLTSGGRSDTADELLRDAESALSQAKKAGAGEVLEYHPKMRTSEITRFQLKNDLRSGIADGELVVYYQPIVVVETVETVGYEALARWMHPRRGLLGPGEFIPLAEESGLIAPLGLHILEVALAQILDWNIGRADHALRMSVNVSTRQLEEEAAINDLLAVIRSSGVDPARIVLEITESAMMSASSDGQRKIQRLRDTGAQLAIDDFGTGYSSLSQVQQFAFDILKIDRSFISGVDKSRNDRLLLERIISIANDLNAQTVAEGIEREGELAVVQSLGCNYAQGFFFSQPMPAEATVPVPLPLTLSRR